MEDQTKEIQLTREDILSLTLHERFASWCGAVPMEYRLWLNQLLPLEEGQKLMSPLREVDIECQCLLAAITKKLQENCDDYDGYTGSALAALIQGLKMLQFTYPSRARGMEDGATILWSVKRHKNTAWFVEHPQKSGILERLFEL
jgi:hypothetical protein